MLSKKIFCFSIFLLAITGQLCFAMGSAFTENSQNTDILIIIEQWAAIEHRLMIEGIEDSTLENIDIFRGSVQSYLDSEIYRIYRLVPFSSKTTFGAKASNEIPEIQAAADLALSLREAVLNSELEKAKLISAQISGNLIQALKRNAQADLFAGGAYFRLFLAFILFITLTAVVIYFLYKELIRSLKREAEVSVFSSAILLAQEDERSRLSRELHDTIAQDLRYLSMEMNKISKTEEKTEREKLCADAASLQSDLIGKVRIICDGLVPPDFRFQGLPDALRRHCHDFGKRTGLDCRINIEEDAKLDFLDEEKQLQIFRIVQEALTNTEKHAEAAEVIVVMRCDASRNLSVCISDDGKGFNPSAEREQNRGAHLGIRGMNERAVYLGGTLEIKSEYGEGTLVFLKLLAAKLPATKLPAKEKK
ncbi:MAG: sensor histidine kinase [Treponema sp.]|nr:sensor histidine kinase [Treponema sp.]